MDNLVGNSFFYFFSATPQVLGGILALFGVFIVFKIKTIKDELIGMGESIYDKAYNAVTQQYAKLSEKVSSTSILDMIKISIEKKDISQLKADIGLIENYDYLIQRNKYYAVYNFLQKLILQTISWSIFTAIIIFLCLATIPFGDFIINHPILLICIFCAFILFILICLSGLIYILVKSLFDTYSTIWPHSESIIHLKNIIKFKSNRVK